MKMDRNLNVDGCGKYAIVNLRKLRAITQYKAVAEQALKDLAALGVLEWGRTGEQDEFFLIKLKDLHARPALAAYSDSIHPTDPQFAAEVFELAQRSGRHSPFCKEPD